MSQLDEAQVIDFLEQNNDFLQKHPDLLTHLFIFDEPSGTTSLVRKQQALLQNKNRELSDKLIALLENASRNEQIFKVFNQCNRILLETTHFTQLGNQLQQLLCKEFDLIDCQLLAFDLDKHHALISRYFNQQSSFLGRLNQQEQFLLFSQAVGSVAIYLIGDVKNPTAILAFASDDEAYYRKEQSSVFVLEFIKALDINLAQL
jgi:hypothetical protein